MSNISKEKPVGWAHEDQGAYIVGSKALSPTIRLIEGVSPALLASDVLSNVMTFV
jgi:hypothetical protein